MLVIAEINDGILLGIDILSRDPDGLMNILSRLLDFLKDTLGG